MAAEDEAMLVTGVSLADPDGDPDGEETRLRVDIWAEKGRVGLPARVNTSSELEIEERLGDDEDGDLGFVMTGNETALNYALAGLVYYPPPDWTSFKQVCNSFCLRWAINGLLPPVAPHWVTLRRVSQGLEREEESSNTRVCLLEEDTSILYVSPQRTHALPRTRGP